MKTSAMVLMSSSRLLFILISTSAFGLLNLHSCSKLEDNGIFSFGDSPAGAIRFTPNITRSSIFEGEEKKDNFVLMLLKLAGISGENLNSYAVTGIITLLRLLGQVLVSNETITKRKRRGKNFSPFSFLVNEPHVLQLLPLMQNPEIVDMLLEEEQRTGDADCIRLLICKTAPFIKGMQKSLSFFLRGKEESGRKKRNSADGEIHEEDILWRESNTEDRMFFFFPTLQEVIRRGGECENRFTNCIY